MPDPIAATAVLLRRAILRTRVRFAFSAFVLCSVLVGVSATAPQRVNAKPMSEVTTSWIAVMSREIATELRGSRNLPIIEQRAVAGRQISQVAGVIASVLSVDADQLRTTWAATSLTRKIALFTALSQLGVPYRLNADAPFISLDCSALTKFAWAQAGVEIDRGSQYQYAYAERVSRENVQAGDLVWYPGHIMLSLGLPDLIVHARSGERAVEIHRIDSNRMSWMQWVSPL